LQAIICRKRAEGGQDSAPVTDEMAELYEVIELVKEEKRR
jgi:hypothetical protein